MMQFKPFFPPWMSYRIKHFHRPDIIAERLNR